MRLVTYGLEGYEFENTYNNDKNFSEIQLEHGKEDELVAVMVKDIENGLLEEVEKFGWWFEQDIDDEEEEDEEGKGGSEVFIPINEPKRHWSLAQFHIQSGNVTFNDSQKTYDVEYRLWYVKMRSSLESKLHVLLHRTSVFASKGIDPTSYSIKLAHGIPLDVEDPIQTALAYREKMIKLFFEHKIICPS
ncbi:phospholipase-like protein [Tanacetum coccineum]